MQRAEQAALASQVAQPFGLRDGAALVDADPSVDLVVKTANLLQAMVHQLARAQLALSDQIHSDWDGG